MWHGNGKGQDSDLRQAHANRDAAASYFEMDRSEFVQQAETSKCGLRYRASGGPLEPMRPGPHIRWIRSAPGGQDSPGSDKTLRFLSPPSEPDVRVSTHPALHEHMPSGYAIDPDALLAQGVAMLSAR